MFRVIQKAKDKERMNQLNSSLAGKLEEPQKKSNISQKSFLRRLSNAELDILLETWMY